jgi:hypothetical protein
METLEKHHPDVRPRFWKEARLAATLANDASGETPLTHLTFLLNSFANCAVAHRRANSVTRREIAELARKQFIRNVLFGLGMSGRLLGGYFFADLRRWIHTPRSLRFDRFIQTGTSAPTVS